VASAELVHITARPCPEEDNHPKFDHKGARHVPAWTVILTLFVRLLMSTGGGQYSGQ
jgi:hypothetical protein